MIPKLPSLNHYNYDNLDGSCNCALCKDWRDCTDAYTSHLEKEPAHVWQCDCHTCKEKTKAYNALLCASMKRDTYSELSFITDAHPDKGPFLAWVWRATQYKGRKKTFSQGWWLDQGQKVPMFWWLSKWKMLSGVDLSIPVDEETAL